ncbi:MAG: antitoxin family protein [Chloroherpetonaceae bacterium]
MVKVITATYDGEVFRPIEKIDLLPHTKVQLIIEISDTAIQNKRERLVKIAEQTCGVWADNPQVDTAMEELNQTFKQWDAYLKSL